MGKELRKNQTCTTLLMSLYLFHYSMADKVIPSTTANTFMLLKFPYNFAILLFLFQDFQLLITHAQNTGYF